MKCVFSAKLNEIDLIKLKIPSDSEICGIIVGDRTMYDEIIKERLSCKICLKYEVPSLGGLSSSKPFQCLHYFHPQCVTNWKPWSLTIGNRSGPDLLLFCGSKLCIRYKDLYDYEWNFDGTVTRFNSNSRYPIGLDTNIAVARSSRSVPNNPNPNQI